MKEKKISLCILDENDCILRKSTRIKLKWTDELEKDMMEFHNIKAEDEVVDMLFSNIIESINGIITKEEMEKLKNG